MLGLQPWWIDEVKIEWLDYSINIMQSLLISIKTTRVLIGHEIRLLSKCAALHWKKTDGRYL